MLAMKDFHYCLLSMSDLNCLDPTERYFLNRLFEGIHKSRSETGWHRNETMYIVQQVPNKPINLFRLEVR